MYSFCHVSYSSEFFVLPMWFKKAFAFYIETLWAISLNFISSPIYCTSPSFTLRTFFVYYERFLSARF
jgi:hypothetical protein